MKRRAGGVAEWFKAPVLKTGVGASPPWVRIPPPPPLADCPPWHDIAADHRIVTKWHSVPPILRCSSIS